MKNSQIRHIDKIFLSSTDYDQHDFRNSLFDALNRLGFTVHTFKTAENNPYPEAHSHDECLAMIDKMDCVVGIIGTRPGNKYIGKRLEKSLKKSNRPRNVTITQAEIIYALEKRKLPTIILVRNGVWDKRKAGGLDPIMIDFLDYLTRREKGNYLNIDVADVNQAVSIVTNKALIIPRKRLYLLGEAMSGENWNGKNFFKDKEVTVQNKNADGYTALNELRVVGKDLSLIEREERLKWLLGLLKDKETNDFDIDFLLNYILEYTGYSNAGHSIKEQALNDRKAINLLERMRFGDDSVFGGYKHSINGGFPEPLKWPQDCRKWSAHGRIEFILYSLQLENGLPINLRRMIEFSAAINSSTGSGFVAHYSRKPVTVGCIKACEVRLTREGGKRGIAVNLEMKSMLYLVILNGKYCLVAVHGEGDKDVDENAVIKAVSFAYDCSVKKIPTVNPSHLYKYLTNISSPLPLGKISSGRKLSMNGAQQLIGLYASSINPVSILKSVEFKYSFISQYTEEQGFDVLMLWDNEILKINECYNNAGSPTWGLRFDPKSMLDHVKINAELLATRYYQQGIRNNFKIMEGSFFRNYPTTS